MARVANNKRDKVRGALTYMEEKIHDANKKLKMESEPHPELDSTYKAGLDGSAKNDLKSVIKMIRWLANDLSLGSIPSAFTNTQIDSIDAEIRTHEE